jgi:hypothetical protein
LAAFEVYVIDANRMFIIETDDAKAQSGDMRKQQQATYSGANFSGPVVSYGQGPEYSNGSVSGYFSFIGQGTANGAGGFAYNQMYHDDNGAYTAGGDTIGVTSTCTFDTANPGRCTGTSPVGDAVYLYFFNTNSAFVLDWTTGKTPQYMGTGYFEPQSETTFTYAAVAGTYMMGQLPKMEPGSNSNVGEINVSSSDAITGGSSEAGAGDFSYDQALSMTYAWDTTAPGTGTYIVFQASSPVDSCAVISSTKAVCIVNTDDSPTVMILQQ